MTVSWLVVLSWWHAARTTIMLVVVTLLHIVARVRAQYDRTIQNHIMFYTLLSIHVPTNINI